MLPILHIESAGVVILMFLSVAIVSTYPHDVSRLSYGCKPASGRVGVPYNNSSPPTNLTGVPHNNSSPSTNLTGVPYNNSSPFTNRTGLPHNNSSPSTNLTGVPKKNASASDPPYASGTLPAFGGDDVSGDGWHPFRKT